MKNKLNTEVGESDSPKSRAKCPTCHDPLSGNGFILWCENGHVFEHPAASVSAWLLEDGSEKPRYIMADESGLGWTDDIGEALRMARRADCEALAKIVEDAWHIRQHSFPVSACGKYLGEPGGNCTRCGLIAYEHERHVLTCDSPRPQEPAEEFAKRYHDKHVLVPAEFDWDYACKFAESYAAELREAEAPHKPSPELRELLDAAEQILAWQANCSLGSSGDLRQKRLRAALDNLAAK